MPLALPLGRRPVTHCRRGWVGLKADLDGCRKSRPHLDINPWLSSQFQVTIPTTLSSISLCGILNSTTATTLLSIRLGETIGLSSCHAGRLSTVSWHLTCHSHFPQTRTQSKVSLTHSIVTKLFWAFHVFPIGFSSLKWSLPQMHCSFKQVIRNHRSQLIYKYAQLWAPDEKQHRGLPLQNSLNEIRR